MKWATISLGLLVAATASGCWRPYYGQTYATPAYPQAPAYQQAPAFAQQAPVYSQAPVMQPTPVYSQAPVMQQGCAPVVCQPQQCSCY